MKKSLISTLKNTVTHLFPQTPQNPAPKPQKRASFDILVCANSATRTNDILEKLHSLEAGTITVATDPLVAINRLMINDCKTFVFDCSADPRSWLNNSHLVLSLAEIFKKTEFIIVTDSHFASSHRKPHRKNLTITQDISFFYECYKELSSINMES